jgi:hypothetical protein
MWMWAVLPQTSVLTMEAAFTFIWLATMVTSTQRKNQTEETSTAKHRESLKPITNIHAGFEVLTVVAKMVIFWDVTSCSSVKSVTLFVGNLTEGTSGVREFPTGV